MVNVWKMELERVKKQLQDLLTDKKQVEFENEKIEDDLYDNETKILAGNNLISSIDSDKSFTIFLNVMLVIAIAIVFVGLAPITSTLVLIRNVFFVLLGFLAGNGLNIAISKQQFYGLNHERLEKLGIDSKLSRKQMKKIAKEKVEKLEAEYEDKEVQWAELQEQNADIITKINYQIGDVLSELFVLETVYDAVNTQLIEDKVTYAPVDSYTIPPFVQSDDVRKTLARMRMAKDDGPINPNE